MKEKIYWTGNLAMDRGLDSAKAPTPKQMAARDAGAWAWYQYEAGKAELVQRRIAPGVYEYILQYRKTIKRPLVWY